MARFSQESLTAARAIFSGDDKEHPACHDCGGVHPRACPRIASERLVLDKDQNVTEREVTYWAPGTWETNVIFAEDVFDDVS